MHETGRPGSPHLDDRPLWARAGFTEPTPDGSPGGPRKSRPDPLTLRIRDSLAREGSHRSNPCRTTLGVSGHELTLGLAIGHDAGQQGRTTCEP